MSAEMILTLAFFALLVFGYCFAVAKVWRGESEFDGDDPPAWWPFSLPLWRGTGRALPVQGLSVLVLIGAGIVSDLVGSDSRDYDLVMAIGCVGLLGIFCLAFPITYYNRPKWLVPPVWRDDPGAVEEWRAERARRKAPR
jgi:hypothetical protein